MATIPDADPAIGLDHPPVERLLAASGTSSNDVWAVGSYRAGREPSSARALIEHWNGRGWKSMRVSGTADRATLSTISALTPNDVWASGSNGHTSWIFHWNGVRWSHTGLTGLPGTQLMHITAITSGDAWAVGLQARRSEPVRAIALHWNGRRWLDSHLPFQGEAFNALDAVSGIRPHDVWAGGAYDWTGRFEGYRLLEHWNGKRWSIVPTPKRRGWVRVLLAQSAHEVWQVGVDQSFDLPIPPSSWLNYWNSGDWSNIGVTHDRFSNFEALIPVPADGVWLIGQESSSGQLLGEPKWASLVDRIKC